ncbi:hypothetical protein EVAR_38175_1 [Eumeta japonica]|uniref:Uncharacterized protein n=1 Tax=Eumeta variegata TaxID=151549 RepID=A0A4C1WH00_EUMVA|nr:hypothetical protein EVAR_38175_1 [Eumeta japonica]
MGAINTRRRSHHSDVSGVELGSPARRAAGGGRGRGRRAAPPAFTSLSAEGDSAPGDAFRLKTLPVTNLFFLPYLLPAPALGPPNSVFKNISAGIVRAPPAPVLFIAGRITF